jgi:protein O-GlcNAc transferase
MADAHVTYDGKDVVFYDAQLQDNIESWLLAGNWYELLNLEFIRKLQVEGNYVDVGAYIGTHSIFFSLFCPSTLVYSFEPQADVYPKLVRNLAANSVTNCQAFNVALSDTAATGTINGPASNVGGARLYPGNEVAVVTLDSFNFQGVTLLKIDVEGMELHVLRGATELLKGVKHLFVEIWPKERAESRASEYTFDKIVEFLKPFGIHHHTSMNDDLHYFKKG